MIRILGGIQPFATELVRGDPQKTRFLVIIPNFQYEFWDKLDLFW